MGLDKIAHGGLMRCSWDRLPHAVRVYTANVLTVYISNVDDTIVFLVCRGVRSRTYDLQCSYGGGDAGDRVLRVALRDV